jgi:hypothetical protein
VASRRDHDRWPFASLIERFEQSRSETISALRAAQDVDLERGARHPRLGTPMPLVDLAYFVAEHDDHHMARMRELITGNAEDSPEF